MEAPTASARAPAIAHARSDVADYPFDSHFLVLDAGRMHYLDEGPRDRAPLLMLHGNPTWSFFFRRLVAGFRGDHRVVVPDHLGCGLSDKPESWRYDLEGHVQNLERLVSSLALDRITLVVHDWGGAIGMGFAARHPEKIARLVILNSAAFLSREIPFRIRVCRWPVLGPFLIRRMNAFAGLAPRMASARRGGIPNAAKRGLLLPYDSYAHRVATWRFVADIPLRARDHSYAVLAKIDRSLGIFSELPTCIVWGERDFCFTPRFRAEWQRRFPDAEVHRLENAGHYVLEDDPDAVESAVRSFLARHPVRGGSS